MFSRRDKDKTILNREEVSRFKNLLMFARSTVEGYFSGKHKSPDFGSSAEFAEYSQYLPGDDVSKVDWHVYGKTRRLFTRKYQEETDMVMYLLVDTSQSMRYFRPGMDMKVLQASKIAAALAYLMIQQGDKVSLTLFDEKVHLHLPSGGTRNHLYNIIHQLESIRPRSGTQIHHAIVECTSIFRKRGKIVILSDFWSDTEALFKALDRFIHRKFDILLLHIMDKDELELPYFDNARFIDMESKEQIQVEPGEIRDEYRQKIKEWLDTLTQQANNRRIRYDFISTENSYLDAIEAYLKFNARGKNSHVGF